MCVIKGCLVQNVNMHEGEVSSFTTERPWFTFLYTNDDCFSTFFDCCSYVFLPALFFYLHFLLVLFHTTASACRRIRHPLFCPFPSDLRLSPRPPTHTQTHTLCSHESAFSGCMLNAGAWSAKGVCSRRSLKSRSPS